jgi:hypothetical protein
LAECLRLHAGELLAQLRDEFILGRDADVAKAWTAA